MVNPADGVRSALDLMDARFRNASKEQLWVFSFEDTFNEIGS